MSEAEGAFVDGGAAGEGVVGAEGDGVGGGEVVDGEVLPEPLMELERLRVPERSMRSVPLLMMEPLPGVPVAPSLPICRVPALMVVVPW